MISLKDEIKEILDKLKKTADTSFFAICSSKEELKQMPKSVSKILSLNDKQAKLLLDHITNLQEKYEEADNNRHKLFEQKKTIKYCELNKEFTPRLEDVENILNGGDDNE